MTLFAPPRRFRSDDIVISSLGSWQSDAQDYIALGGAAIVAGAVNVNSANNTHRTDGLTYSTALGVAFETATPIALKEFWWSHDGSANSKYRMVSCALHDDSGALLFQTVPVVEGWPNEYGSIAMSAMDLQKYDLDDYILQPGRYVMSIIPGNTNGLLSQQTALMLECAGCVRTLTVNPTINVTATARGAGSDKVAGTSFGFSPASNFAAKSLAVLVLAVDNSTTGGTTTPVTTVTDSQGNIWARTATPSGVFDPGLVNEGLCLEWWECYPSALGTGDTITVSFSTSTTAKAWVLWELTSPAGTTPMGYDNWEFGSGTGTSITTGTVGGSSTRQQGDLILCVGGAEGTGTFTGDSDTDGGSWSSGQTAATAGGAATDNMAIYSQAKTISDRSSQSWTVTISTSEDWARGFAYYMAFPAEPTLRGNGNDKTAGTTFGFSPSSNFAASKAMAVLIVACDSLNGNTTVNTITDTNGNTWTKHQTNVTGTGATHVHLSTWYTTFDGGVLDTGDTITLNFLGGSVTAKVYQLWEVLSPTWKPQMWRDGNGATGTSTTPDSGVGPNGFGPQVFGIAAIKAPITVTTPDSNKTNGGPWGPVQLDKTTGGADNTNVALVTQKKCNYSFTDTEPYNITVSISAVWAAQYVTIGADAHAFPATATWIAPVMAEMPYFGLTARALI